MFFQGWGSRGPDAKPKIALFLDLHMFSGLP